MRWLGDWSEAWEGRGWLNGYTGGTSYREAVGMEEDTCDRGEFPMEFPALLQWVYGVECQRSPAG